ncbi:MAG: Sensor protein QseC [Desulfovibrio sp.]
MRQRREKLRQTTGWAIRMVGGLGRLVTHSASEKSLRFRLSVFFSIFLAAAWLTAAFVAWKECREYMDEFFDSQQMLLAKTLAFVDFSRMPPNLPQARYMLPGVGKKGLGDLEDEAIGFAVFSADGRTILTDGQKGRHFPFERSKRGFSTVCLIKGDDAWRILWMDTHDGKHVIAVGQEVDYRREMALDMLSEQIMPWLLLLPVLLVGLYVLLTRELAPLRSIAASLQSREPENTVQLDLQGVPSEVLPIVKSLNAFFSRTSATLARERAFISDAAHELRTPLAGLRLQAQVAARQNISPEEREEALAFIQLGADRCARLVEQMLALSRLEALHAADAPQKSAIRWASLLEELVGEYRAKIQSRAIQMESQITALAATAQGYPALITLLLRNLLENAVNYTPAGGHISIFLDSSRLVIQNDCAAIPSDCAARLGERFYRPPGQEEPGSGLGLSIAKRVADIHHFSLSIKAGKSASGSSSNSFTVTLTW